VICAVIFAAFLTIGGYGYYIVMSEAVAAHNANFFALCMAAMLSGYGWFMFVSRVDDHGVMRISALVPGIIVMAGIVSTGFVIAIS
jgi:hypothetical protein